MNSFKENSLQQVFVPTRCVLLDQRLAIVYGPAVKFSGLELDFVPVRLQERVRLSHDYASLELPAILIANQLVLLLEQVVLLPNLLQHHLFVRAEVVFVDRLVVDHHLRHYFLPRRQIDGNAPNPVRDDRLLDSVRGAQSLRLVALLLGLRPLFRQARKLLDGLLATVSICLQLFLRGLNAFVIVRVQLVAAHVSDQLRGGRVPDLLLSIRHHLGWAFKVN